MSCPLVGSKRFPETAAVRDSAKSDVREVPFLTDQMCAVWSVLAEMSRAESAANTADEIEASCLSSGPTGRPVLPSHSWMLESLLAVTTKFPSGLNSIFLTFFGAFRNVTPTGFPSATLQSCISLFLLTARIVDASGSATAGYPTARE